MSEPESKREINRVLLSGRLAGEPELRELARRQRVGDIALGVSVAAGFSEEMWP